MKKALLSWICAGCRGVKLLRDALSDTTYSLLEFSKTTDTQLWQNIEVLSTPEEWVAFDRSVSEALQAHGVYQPDAPMEVATSSPEASAEEALSQLYPYWLGNAKKKLLSLSKSLAFAFLTSILLEFFSLSLS